jgi:hypothetical protein
MFKVFRLKLKAAKRLGAFSRAFKGGASIEDARTHSDKLYPPTADDIDYEDRLRRGAQLRSRFPWVSSIALLAPIGCAISLSASTPAPVALVTGSGLANLGYVLFAAGIFTGKFGVFGLSKRWQVILLAAICFVVGTLLCNIDP